MRIAYFLSWDLRRESGVLKKITGQVHAWRAAGHRVRLFALSPAEGLWDGVADLGVELVPAASRMARVVAAAELVGRVLAWRPEAVYVRWAMNYPALGRLTGSAPTVLEVNTDDVAEFRHTLAWWQYAYHRLTRGRVLRRAAGLVAVAEGIAARLAHFGRPTRVIGNGIDLAAFPPLAAASGSVPRLVFLGSPGCPWHGVDKMVALAERLPRCHFDLIGVDAGSAARRRPNVSLHGLLGRREYLPLLARADVAIGSLAFHRIPIADASPLKVREYLACGLPTIIGCRDSDFPRPVPFLLQLPNTPDNVVAHVDRIHRFVAAWRGRRVPRDEIAHLDVRVKEAQRLAFIRSLLGRGEPSALAPPAPGQAPPPRPAPGGRPEPALLAGQGRE